MVKVAIVSTFLLLCRQRNDDLPFGIQLFWLSSSLFHDHKRCGEVQWQPNGEFVSTTRLLWSDDPGGMYHHLPVISFQSLWSWHSAGRRYDDYGHWGTSLSLSSGRLLLLLEAVWHSLGWSLLLCRLLLRGCGSLSPRRMFAGRNGTMDAIEYCSVLQHHHH